MKQPRWKPFGLLIAAFFMSLAAGARADTLNVPSASYPTIQSAVDAAHPGDTLLVGPGVYQEQISWINKELTIRSTSGPESTIFDAATTHRSFYAGQFGANSRLEGFTFQNAADTAFVGFYNGNLTIANCIFQNNRGGDWGGGILLFSGPHVDVVNCKFLNNTANLGGAIAVLSGGQLNVVNSTLVGNSAGFAASIYSTTPLLTVSNSIVWDNASWTAIFSDGGGTTRVTNSDVMSGYPGAGNISADPLFVDAANGDYSLKIGSPCVDKGNNAAIPAGIVYDLVGLPRIGNGIAEMGAYELDLTPNLTFNKPVLVGGSTATLTGTITLRTPAPVGGTQVSFSSDSSLVTAPAILSIPAGATTKTFKLNHMATDMPSVSTVFAHWQGYVGKGEVTLNPFAIVGVKVSKSSVLATDLIDVTFRLDAIPVNALRIPVISANPAILSVHFVDVPAGARTVTATFTAGRVTAATRTTFSAFLGNSVDRSILVQPGLASVRLDSAPLYGLGTCIGTLSIPIKAPAGGWTVQLSSDNCQVPSFVTIPAGSTTATFDVTAADFDNPTTATVYATGGNRTLSATKTITPNYIAVFDISPSTFVGGSATNVIGTVKLKARVAEDTRVRLTLSNRIISVPATVLIPKGQDTATFPVTHSAVNSPKTVRITATRLGRNVNKTLTVN